MKNFLLAALLSVVSVNVFAEPHPRQIRFMCASLEDLEMTIEKYNEKLVIATKAPNGRSVNMLYANFETQTSSWVIHDLQTDDYCMIGVGDAIHLPDDSPIGTRINYK